jgi:hypothetical protein
MICEETGNVPERGGSILSERKLCFKIRLVEDTMKDQDKTKETLIRELEELRQRVRFMESIVAEQNTDSQKTYESNSQNLPGKEVWRLPGYWH